MSFNSENKQDIERKTEKITVSSALNAFVRHTDSDRYRGILREFLEYCSSKDLSISEQNSKIFLAHYLTTRNSISFVRTAVNQFVRFASKQEISSVLPDWREASKTWSQFVDKFLSHPVNEKKVKINKIQHTQLMRLGGYLALTNQKLSLYSVLKCLDETLMDQDDDSTTINHLLLSIKNLVAWLNAEPSVETFEEFEQQGDSILQISYIHHVVYLRSMNLAVLSTDAQNRIRQDMTDSAWRSVFSLMFSGVTLVEIKKIRIGQLDLPARTVSLGEGKINGYQRIRIDPTAAKDLSAYLSTRLTQARLSRNAWLYPSLEEELNENAFVKGYAEAIEKAQRAAENIQPASDKTTGKVAEILVDKRVNPAYLPVLEHSNVKLI